MLCLQYDAIKSAYSRLYQVMQSILMYRIVYMSLTLIELNGPRVV